MQNGLVDWNKIGIRTPHDLIKFDWEDCQDTSEDNMPSDDEIDAIRHTIQMENKKLQKEREM